MSVLDVQDLLAPISSDQPCGEDLEYDTAFAEMERAATGREEQQFGSTIIEGEGPDWPQVQRTALKLFERTKDLRVTVYLARSAIAIQGWPEFCDALAVLRGLIENYWVEVYPRLDPDDDNDPTIRVNTLTTLCDRDATLNLLRKAPLVRSRVLGMFGLREIDIAKGEVTPIGDESAPELSAIEGAFADASPDDLKSLHVSLQQALEHVKAIELAVTEQVGVSNSVQMAPLQGELRRAERFVAEQIDRLGLNAAAEPETEGTVAVNGSGGTGTVGQQVTRPLEAINSRDDVIRALDKICEYYDRHEPSSPLPLLLQRAKRLASKSFVEILRDLAPNGLDQALSIGGVPQDE